MTLGRSSSLSRRRRGSYPKVLTVFFHHYVDLFVPCVPGRDEMSLLGVAYHRWGCHVTATSSTPGTIADFSARTARTLLRTDKTSQFRLCLCDSARKPHSTNSSGGLTATVFPHHRAIHCARRGRLPWQLAQAQGKNRRNFCRSISWH